ncbi:MAG: outer membrane protein assembly factor BamD [Myxococcota bacterium]|nr:outer membrane protein assembly factor BamD [Myxococcota bacterium]
MSVCVMPALLLLFAQVQSPMMGLEDRSMNSRDRSLAAVADQETDPAKYRAKAKALYLHAESLLKRDLGMEAAQTFSSVIEQYPFSRYAVMAELGHALSLAAQGESEGALAGFTRFLKQHPGHPKTVDVRYAIVTTNWSERPGDFILLPPPHERDLEDARGTLIAANAFLRQHGADERAAEVRKIKRAARSLLYRQALFLAHWTADQGRPHAALVRWTSLREEFAEQPLSAKDELWSAALTQRVAKTPLKLPKEPELYPAAPVVKDGQRP